MKRILIVDDSPVIRSVIKIFLEQMRYEFLEAGSVAEAMQRLDDRTIDLAIVDVNLPGTSGVVLVERLRAHARPNLREVPVVVLTADRTQSLAARCQAAGANAVLRKPVSSAGLLTIVRELAPPVARAASA